MSKTELDLSALIDHLQNAINYFLQIQFDDFPRLSLVCFGLLQSSCSFAGFWILIPCGRRLNSPSLGISRDRRGHKARARASSVSLGVRMLAESERRR
jgi:hypothetical protein